MPKINRGTDSPTSSEGQSVVSMPSRGKGYGLFAGRMNSKGQWEPTVVALIVLILLEFAAYAALRYSFRSVHGG